MSDLRQRKPAATPSPPASPTRAKSARKASADDDSAETPLFTVADVLRGLSGLLLLSCLFSWLVTDGSSLTWNYRPRISRWRVLKAAFVRLPRLAVRAHN